MTLTLLEKKLIELGEPIRIVTYHDSEPLSAFTAGKTPFDRV